MADDTTGGFERIDPAQGFQRITPAEETGGFTRVETQKPGTSPGQALKHALPGSMVIPFIKRMGEGILETAKSPGETFKRGAAGQPIVPSEQLVPEAANLAMLGGVRLGKSPVRAEIPKAVEAAPVEPTMPGLKEAVVDTADELNRLRQSGVADRAQVSQHIEQTPKELREPVAMERIYHATEDPSLVPKLPPSEQEVISKVIDPMRKEGFELLKKIRGYGATDIDFDPTYMHRIAKGHAPSYDSMRGDAYDPVVGTRSLKRQTSATKERSYFAIEDEGGRRFVISKGDDGTQVWRDGRPHKIGDIELRPGTEHMIAGHPWKVTQARTSEIEANTATRYHKNPVVNMADALVRMREVARNVEFLDKFKTDMQAQGRAVPIAQGRPAQKGFVETKIPQLRGMAFEPKIAHVLDDFYKPGLEGLEGLRKINQFATGSIFWNPIPHIENVAAHWFTGRGWDWIRPGPIKGFATDAGRAIKEVITQGPEYQRLLREGSGLVSGGVRNADFYQAMGKRFGMDIERNWGEWKPYFDKVGLKTPYEAVAWWYDKMRSVLWQTNDMFMMHRVLELERKGLSARAAIKEAEKHIPNYRIPSEVLNSRMFSRILQDPAVTIFSRYHYGMWKSYMNVLADMGKGAPKEKLDALGNLAALGFLLFMVYPAVDFALQKLTGDPKAEKLRRGSTSIPQWTKELYQGDMTFPQFLSNTITLAPATKEGMQQFVGKDWFTGRDLGGPVPRAEHAAGALVNPYSIANQLTDTRPGGRETGRTVLDQIVGARNVSERTLRGRERAKKQRERDDRYREKHPRGLIEKGYQRLRYGGTDE